MSPPAGATVLFDGVLNDRLIDSRTTAEGWLDVGFSTRDPVRDFHLHVEFRTPFESDKRGQGRGNSGVYLQRRYEVQILDSFGLDGQANECGGLYRQRPPALNMALPPLSWQTYDIDFRAARFDGDGNKTDNARITVRHNGIKIHDDVELTGPTGNGRPESAEPLPIHFQDHTNPVRFRNLWIATVEDDDSRTSATELFADDVSCQSGRARWRLRKSGPRFRR